MGADDEDLAARCGPQVLLHGQHGLDGQNSQLQHLGLVAAPRTVCGGRATREELAFGERERRKRKHATSETWFFTPGLLIGESDTVVLVVMLFRRDADCHSVLRNERHLKKQKGSFAFVRPGNGGGVAIDGFRSLGCEYRWAARH